jgi:ABC-type methionine transport system ATPase subunit
MSIAFRNVALPPILDLSAEVPGGAIIGILGEKGSGIPELLKIAGGVAAPASGTVGVNGDRRYLALGDTLNLAPTAILALDQALAAQDAVVRTRTLLALDRLRRAGSTILLASHEYSLLEQLCDEVWWLDAGRLAAKGDPRVVLSAYRKHVAGRIRAWGEDLPPRLDPSYRRGDGRGEVVNIETLGANGKPTIVWNNGEPVKVRATVRYHEAVPRPVVGLMIRTQIGFEVYGTNTELEGIEIGPRDPGDVVTFEFAFNCDLCPRVYTLTLASHDPDGAAHDWLDDALTVTVVADRWTAGVADLRSKLTVAE